MATTLAQVRTANQISELERLLDELEAWDRAMCREIGIDIEKLLDLHYRRPTADLVAEMAPPDGRLLLAIDDGRALGCGGIRRLDPRMVELVRIYVRPEARGRGVGRALVQALISEARLMGASAVRLETATFMTEAQSLYRSLGFEVIAPYRDVPSELMAAEVFMGRDLTT